jgi:multiple sugar transport system permease protein
MTAVTIDRLKPRRVPHLTLRQRFFVIAILLLLPAVALRVFTTVYPLIQTAQFSVQRINPAFPPPRYVGLGNFERLAGDPVVQASVSFTILFVVASTLFQMILGLAVAHLLNVPFRLRGIARTVSLIPWAMPMIVAALGFRWMFDDQFGMIPDLLRRIFNFETQWLIDPSNAKLAVILVSVWKSTPFVALILLAGLQGISRDLYEAAKVDGATAWQSFRHITLPMLMPIIVTVSMFMLVWQLAVFDLPYAMTGGGPGFSTTVLAQKIYLEITTLNYGYAASLSIVLVGIVAIIGLIGLFLFRRFEVHE